MSVRPKALDGSYQMQVAVELCNSRLTRRSCRLGRWYHLRDGPSRSQKNDIKS